MGGMNSGNHKYNAKALVGQLPNIDIRKLYRDGWLTDEPQSHIATWTKGDNKQHAQMQITSSLRKVEFLYSSNGKRQGGTVDVDTTPCELGGERVWFCCPVCARRCAILYPRPAIACRQCHKLTYASRNETDCDQASRQADRIRKRLGWELGIVNGEGWKPSGMHQRTYERLLARHRHYEFQFMRNAPRFAALLDSSVGFGR